MNIPIAPITDENVNIGIIIDDNSGNTAMTHADIEATQLINQTAFLEVIRVSQFSDTHPPGNYDNDALRMNFSILSSISNPLALQPRQGLDDDLNSEIIPSMRITYNQRSNLNPEGKIVCSFLFIILLIIIIFSKSK